MGTVGREGGPPAPTATATHTSTHDNNLRATHNPHWLGEGWWGGDWEGPRRLHGLGAADDEVRLRQVVWPHGAILCDRLRGDGAFLLAQSCCDGGKGILPKSPSTGLNYWDQFLPPGELGYWDVILPPWGGSVN